MAANGNAENKSDKVPFRVARNWQGMTLSTWFRLLFRHRFAISPRRLPMVLRITMFAIFNSGLDIWEKWSYGDGIKTTVPRQEPLLVIGHWRTGTTWLHELLTQDKQFSYPTTYQCMAPHHFLLTQDWLPKLLRHLLPQTRPMDNMSVGWNRPQEDEFALCNLGLPSPYLVWGFPEVPNPYQSYLALEDVPQLVKERWKRGVRKFLNHLTLGDHRRQVWKSPPHTARIRLLLEVFPRAQFIHIVRNPYVVYASTIRLWQRIWDMMALQKPNFSGLEEFVLDTFSEMYQKFEQDRHLLNGSQLAEVRYEDLVQDIPGEMKRIYDQLNLGDFEAARPKLQQYIETQKDYQTNRFDIPEETRQMISHRWKNYISKYGYDQE